MVALKLSMRLFLSAALIPGLLPFFHSSAYGSTNRVEVSFISEISTVTTIDGDRNSFWLGVDMNIKRGWHVYWRNPGDSGLPTTVQWKEHPFFIPGEIHWPRPSRFDEDGITTYGYSDRVTLLVPVRVSMDSIGVYFPDPDNSAMNAHNDQDGVSEGSDFVLSANINWLVCKDICIPESAQISLPIDRAGRIDGFTEAGTAQLKRALNQVPVLVDDWKAHAVSVPGGLDLTLTPKSQNAVFPNLETVYFYPDTQGLIEHTAPQQAIRDGGGMVLKLQASRYLRSWPEQITGVLSAEDSWHNDRHLPAIEIVIPVSANNKAE